MAGPAGGLCGIPQNPPPGVVGSHNRGPSFLAPPPGGGGWAGEERQRGRADRRERRPRRRDDQPAATSAITTTAADDLVVATFVNYQFGSWTAGPGTTGRYDFDSDLAEDGLAPGPVAPRTATSTVTGPT